MAEPIHFYLLGELRITSGGIEVPPPPYRAYGLLAALLLRPYPQRRERLIGLLFPDTPERSGRRRLSDLLWRVRRSLPVLRMETSVNEISLPPETRWLDVEAFRACAARDSLPHWLEALALYRGDLLEGIYEEWLLPEREALYLQRVRLLQMASTELLGEQEFNRVLPLAEQLLAVEPYDDKALRLLMRAYRGVGRRGAALAAYEHFVSLVAEELHLAPEPATQAMAQAIRGV